MSVDQSKEIKCKILLADDDEARAPANYEAADGVPTAFGELVVEDPATQQLHQEALKLEATSMTRLPRPSLSSFALGLLDWLLKSASWGARRHSVSTISSKHLCASWTSPEKAPWRWPKSGYPILSESCPS